jgi:hypothetical protein
LKVVVEEALADGKAGYDSWNGIPEVDHTRIPLVAAVESTANGKMVVFDLRSTGHAVHSRTNDYARRSIDYCCSSVAAAAEEEEGGLSDCPGTDRGIVDDKGQQRTAEGLVVDLWLALDLDEGVVRTVETLPPWLGSLTSQRESLFLETPNHSKPRLPFLRLLVCRNAQIHSLIKCRIL